MKPTVRLKFALIVVMCLFVAGCKAPPGKNTDFVSSSIMVKHDDLPFHSAWIKEGLDKSLYDKVYIAPVNTSHVLLDEKDWWKNSFKSYSQLKQDVENMAVFMRETFIKAFKEDINKRYTVVDVPEDKTFIVELAITELTPNKPYLKLARFAPFGGGAAVTMLNQTNLSTVSFEARIRDGQTGETVTMFADREQEKKYIATTKNLTWYGHAQTIVEDWAKQFVAIGNRDPGAMVKDSKTFELKPW